MKYQESKNQDKVHYLLSIFDSLDEPVYVTTTEGDTVNPGNPLDLPSVPFEHTFCDPESLEFNEATGEYLTPWGTPVNAFAGGNDAFAFKIADVSVTSTNSTISDVTVACTMATEPVTFSTQYLIGFTATGVANSADISINYALLPAPPIFFKEINGARDLEAVVDYSPHFGNSSDSRCGYILIVSSHFLSSYPSCPMRRYPPSPSSQNIPFLHINV